jgi:rusticyanin
MAENVVRAAFSGSSNGTREAVPMQRNRIVTAALAGGLTIGAISTGYVTAQFVSYHGHNYASQYQNAGNGHTGYTGSPSPEASSASPADPATAMTPAAPFAPATPSDGNTFSDSSLAQFIAQKAGTGLAGRAPQNVPLSQVKALSEQDPAGASIDPRTDTITFYTATVSFTVVAIAPGKPDMTFTVAGLTNPTIIVPRAAQVTVRFMNNDTDEAHGWLITGNKPPFEFGQPATPAIAGAYSGIVGDPTSAGDGANTVSFTASDTGSYDYICPMPGHAQMGMHGSFIVR